MDKKVEMVLRGISHTGYTTELERDAARDLIENLYKENNQLKEQLKTSVKAIRDARYYVSTVGLKSDIVIHTWFIKDLLRILDIDKGE